MKILLIRNAFTHDFGGAERLAVHMAEELQRNKIDTLIVSRQPRLLEYAKGKQVPFHRGLWWSRQNFSGTGTLLFPAYIAWQIVLTIWYICLIIRYKIDLVHALSKDDFIAATIAARLLGKPVVWTDAADLKYVCANNKVWYKNPVGKLVYASSKLSSQIILVSNNEKRLIEESLGHQVPKQWVVIHTAGRDEKVKPRKRDKDDSRAVIFCSTSRLVVPKGIGELVKAFQKLSHDDNGDYRLWLIGDGPDEAEFRKEAGNNPNIVFFGHSDQPLTFLAASDVFVQPTYNEAFSLSLAEAAMIGRPMIATDVGGNPELVNESNGLLVPVQDVEALYEAMKKLAADRTLRETMGKQARQDYKEKFDFGHIIKTRYIPLYEQLSK